MVDGTQKSSDEILAELFSTLADTAQLVPCAEPVETQPGESNQIKNAMPEGSSTPFSSAAIVPASPSPPDVTVKENVDKAKDRDKFKRSKEKKQKKSKKEKKKKKKKERDKEKLNNREQGENNLTAPGEHQKKGKRRDKRDKKEKQKHSKKRIQDEVNRSKERDEGEKQDPRSKDRSYSEERRKKEKNREREAKSDRDSRRNARESYPRDRLESSRRNDRERRDVEKQYSRKSSRYECRSRSRSRSPHRKTRTRSRSKSPAFDKAQLLEIARRNLKKLQDKGVFLGVDGESLRNVKAGGRTVAELTDFCKHLAEKEEEGSHEEGEASSDEETNPLEEKPFTRHPFQLKPRSDPIVMNIRNAVPLPVRKPEERAQLKQQFPVSSGQQHRVNELEWVPVVPKQDAKPAAATVAPVRKKREIKEAEPASQDEVTTAAKTAVVAPQTDPAAAANMDISAIVAQRLSAIRRLQENPSDIEAQLELQEAEFQTRNWASAQHTNPLTGEQMQQFVNFSEAPPVWARKNQFREAAPVAGGVGMRLLQKMGWQPGQGLGRNKEGTLEPLALDVKMDKKGLVSKEEIAPKPVAAKLIQDFNGKHPVSILHELCTKQRWGPPVFEQVADIGPDHQKHFLFKVIVNNVDYRPCVASTTKKEAKAQAAAICLQALGAIPS